VAFLDLRLTGLDRVFPLHASLADAAAAMPASPTINRSLSLPDDRTTWRPST